MEVIDMVYKNNEQIKEFIRMIMAKEKVTYKELAEKTGTSQQNIYKTLNKNQLKFDDVSKVCCALGYKFSFNIVKEHDNNDNDPFLGVLSAMDKLDDMKLKLSEMKSTMDFMSNEIDSEKHKK